MFPTKSKEIFGLKPCPVQYQVRSSGLKFARQRSGRSSELKQKSGRSSRPLSTRVPSSREWVTRANTKFAQANASENQSGFLQLSLLRFPSPFISTTTCNKFRTSCPLLIHTILISMTFLIHSSIYQQPIQTFNGNKYNPNL